MGEGRTDRPERLTVAQCADRLGISEDAVRSRIKRGTLRTEKVAGVVHVLLGADRRTTGQPTDQGNQPATDSRDELIADLREQLEDSRDELIADLRDRVRALEEANRENRRIIMQQAQNLAAIEAPPESRESDSEGADRGEGWETRTEAQSAGEQARVPWWRKLFGRG